MTWIIQNFVALFMKNYMSCSWNYFFMYQWISVTGRGCRLFVCFYRSFFVFFVNCFFFNIARDQCIFGNCRSCCSSFHSTLRPEYSFTTIHVTCVVDRLVRKRFPFVLVYFPRQLLIIQYSLLSTLQLSMTPNLFLTKIPFRLIPKKV
jgi:hypothetical protein